MKTWIERAQLLLLAYLLSRQSSQWQIAPMARSIRSGQSDKALVQYLLTNTAGGLLHTMIKYTLLILAFAIACAIFYNTLEYFFGDTWVTVGIFCVVLIAFRTGLYFYRKSKGIKDTWPND